jgi:DNA-binding NtrC family response regulator
MKGPEPPRFADDPTATWSLAEADVEVGYVHVVEGKDQGSKLPLARGKAMTVGSGKSASVRLTDPTVSRLHCELELKSGSVLVRDLGSKNGVWASGVRLIEAEALPGTRLRIGSSLLEIALVKTRASVPVWSGGDRFHGVLGESAPMHELFTALARIARTSDTVLIRGESGTGKELVARALHDASDRASGPFVVLDGTTLAGDLADTILFGHVKGAFTDAGDDRPGAFELAEGGTLFLDEVGDVPLDLQPKLLRVLEERTVSRLGSSERKRVDVRIVAATHRPLARLVNEKAFREDLWYRLSAFEVRVPALRERPSDVPLLARHLARESGADASGREAVEKLLSARAGYHWPGNVRELRNAVRRTIALGFAGQSGDLEDASFELPFVEAKKRFVDAFEKRYLQRLLDAHGGNISAASRSANMNRGHLSELVATHRLDKR